MLMYDAQHLLVDSLAYRADALLDMELGKACLSEIAHHIGMTVIHPAIGVQFPHHGQSTALRVTPPPTTRNQQMSGYSAFVLLAESHLSVHTFPEANFLTFDFYSCVAFEPADVLKLLNDTFELRGPQVRIVDRQFST